MSPRCTGRERLRHAVTWIGARDAGGFLPLDKTQRDFVERIAKEADAARIFDEAAPSPVAAEIIMRTLVDAVVLRRDVRSIEERENRLLSEKLPRMRRALAELSAFLSEIEAESPGPLDAWIPRNEHFPTARHGLQSLALLIEQRRWIADEAAPRLGLTRKRRTDPSAPTSDPVTLAVAGYVAEGVERAARQPLWEQSAQLAEFVLELPPGSIDPENLRKTTRRRQEAYVDHRSTKRTIRRSK